MSICRVLSLFGCHGLHGDTQHLVGCVSPGRTKSWKSPQGVLTQIGIGGLQVRTEFYGTVPDFRGVDTSVSAPWDRVSRGTASWGCKTLSGFLEPGESSLQSLLEIFFLVFSLVQGAAT